MHSLGFQWEDAMFNGNVMVYGEGDEDVHVERVNLTEAKKKYDFWKKYLLLQHIVSNPYHFQKLFLYDYH
ncbi:hypothetical protein CHUAL_005396 [Chamberlinius hualienensis]